MMAGPWLTQLIKLTLRINLRLVSLRSKATSAPQPGMLWDKIDDLIGKLIHQQHAQKTEATTAGFNPADQSLHERVL